MSPEHDGKLFSSTPFFGTFREKYYSSWSSLQSYGLETFSADVYAMNEPEDLRHELAEQEQRALPEQFYMATQLPLVTFDNHRQFLQHVTSSQRPQLWQWFAGSSSLSLRAAQLPFDMIVLPPIDLRYGWDISNPQHQRALLALDKHFKPQFISMAA